MKPKRKAYFCSPLGCYVLPLTRGLEALLDPEDVVWAEHANWSSGTTGYACAYHYKPSLVLSLHREVAKRAGLLQNEDLEVDHINGNRLDDRRGNLRACSRYENMSNAHKTKRNSSGIKGVCWCSREQRWKGAVMRNRKTHQKLFASKLEAEAWVRPKREELHGDFANHG